MISMHMDSISQSKLREWVDLYLTHVRKITPEVHVRDEEGYKFKSVDTFQRNFDLDAPDLAAMLDRAIENNNLVVGHMNFPRKMLLVFADAYPEETRQTLRTLFDEKQPISARIDQAVKILEGLMDRRNRERDERAQSYVTLRFLSLLLGYRFPNAANAIKPQEWQIFCRFVDEGFRIPMHTSNGGKYEKYEPYIEALRTYIKTLPEVRNLREALTRGLAFRDEAYRWMAQDVIYVTARIKDGEPTTTVQERSADDEATDEAKSVASTASSGLVPGIRFPLEEYLENLLVKNWSEIDFCRDLELYIDADGTSGQQYATDVGIIDLLARDKKTGDLVVIELKRGNTGYQVIGQILAYIDWVENNLVSQGQKVRGIVIVAHGNKALFAALRQVSAKVSIRYYRVNLDIYQPAEVQLD